ncbi:hypothetical protein IVA98_30305 [Bradyrhizobium sp. 160]|nr:hypothetical protein [Bradyrhizobium sp. 160]MCK1627340.1 hypothetical protein [Bradyrhizobium sp. 160]
MIEIFDGHNDTVHRLLEYRPDGIDFLTCSSEIWTPVDKTEKRSAS